MLIKCMTQKLSVFYVLYMLLVFAFASEYQKGFCKSDLYSEIIIEYLTYTCMETEFRYI